MNPSSASVFQALSADSLRDTVRSAVLFVLRRVMPRDR